MSPPKHIAVLGAGITGLSSAFHLSRRFPQSFITLVEKQPRVGGWIRSERVQVNDENDTPTSVLLESGPRTLRPNADSILELINLLNLQNQVIITPTSSPAAKSRFLKLHNTPHGGLTEIPTNPFSLLTSPLRSTLLKPILLEPFKSNNRPYPPANVNIKPNTADADESFHSFFSRRFGQPFATIFGSSLIHGIYAADSRQLSIKAAFPSIYDLVERGGGSLVRGIVKSILAPKKATTGEGHGYRYDLGTTKELMKNAAVFSFRDGMETLPRALEAYLKKRPNVRIMLDTDVVSIERSSLTTSQDTHFNISLRTNEQLTATHIVSTIPPPLLSSLLSSTSDSDAKSPTIPHLTTNPYSTVTVINLIFACSPEKIHPPGFGYLIPRPPNDYPTPTPMAVSESKTLKEDQTRNQDQDQPGILGTVFDSCSLSSQDHPPTAKITKLTLMTGGPYPDFLPSSLFDRSTNTLSGHIPPDTQTPPFLTPILTHLSSTLRSYMGDKALPRPVYYKVTRNVECIPTLLPGHVGRVREMEQVLRGGSETESGAETRTSGTNTNTNRGWDGKLEIIGAGIGGVSVGDCVDAGRRVGRNWV